CERSGIIGGLRGVRWLPSIQDQLSRALVRGRLGADTTVAARARNNGVIRAPVQGTVPDIYLRHIRAVRGAAAAGETLRARCLRLTSRHDAPYSTILLDSSSASGSSSARLRT